MVPLAGEGEGGRGFNRIFVLPLHLDPRQFDKRRVGNKKELVWITCLCWPAAVIILQDWIDLVAERMYTPLSTSLQWHANILALMRHQVSSNLHVYRGRYHCYGLRMTPRRSSNRRSTPPGAFGRLRGNDGKWNIFNPWEKSNPITNLETPKP